MEITTVIGIVGTSIILIFFILNQMRLMSVESIWYDSANLAGSGALIIYAYLIEALPFIVLNAVWFLFSFKDVIIYFTKKENPPVLD